MYKEVKECRICGNSHLTPYLDLGNQPLANSLGLNETKFPLKVLLCEECHLSQLSIVVDPEVLYNNYPYHSSVSDTFKTHCFEFGREVFRTIKYQDRDWVSIMDIAANDGCLLEQFHAAGFTNSLLVGVEPSSNLCEKMRSINPSFKYGSGLIQAHNSFYSYETAKKLTFFDVITATNVLAHVDDVEDFVRGVAYSLQNFNSSIAVFEFPYMVDLIKKTAFDTIYHEHLSYFLLKPIKRLMDLYGLRVFDVKKVPIHGGSIRVYVCPKKYKTISTKESGISYLGKHGAGQYINDIHSSEIYPESLDVQRMLDEEDELGFYDLRTYTHFSEEVDRIKAKFKEQITKLAGKKIMGYGASAKGCNLLNICGISHSDITHVVDDTPDKQGKSVPGLNIPIVSHSHFDLFEPDYIILLAWNFSKELMKKTPNHRNRGGKYIVPIPDVEVL